MSSPQATTARSRSGFLESYFKISERGSTLSREVRGGLVTFFTMAYIVVLNPLIIGTVKDGDGNWSAAAPSRICDAWSRSPRRWWPASSRS